MGDILEKHHSARKFIGGAVDEIWMAQNKSQFPSLDYYERRITEVSTCAPRLLVIATELLEIARRADPAYELQARRSLK